MRVSKFWGGLLLVPGLFAFSGGDSGHFASMAAGSFLGVLGLLVMSGRPILTRPPSRIWARHERVRAGSASDRQTYSDSFRS